MRQVYRQRVLPAHWKTKFKATFNQAAKAAPIGTPFDVDRGPTIVVTDTGNNLSLPGNGTLVCAGGLGTPAWGDPGVWDAARTRVAGRACLARATFSSFGASGGAMLGFDTNQTLNLAAGHGIQHYGPVATYNNSVLTVIAGTLSTGVAYDDMVVLLSEGALIFQKLSTASTWTFLYRSNTGTATPLYATAGNRDAAFTLSGSARPFTVVDLPWGDTSFRSVDVAAPASITPVETELHTASNAAADPNGTEANATTGWTAHASAGAAIASSDVDPSVGTYDLLATSGSGSGLAAYYTIAGAAGMWITLRWRDKTVTGSYQQVIKSSANADLVTLYAYNTSTYGNKIAIYRGQGTNERFSFEASNISIQIRIDNVSVKSMTLVSTLGNVATVGNDGWWEVAPTLTAKTQAGLWICLDDETNPANGYAIYHNGANLIVDQVKAGVWTNLQSTAATYSAGKRICVWKSGTAIRAYYNEAFIGAQLTGDAALTGTKMACFSTLSTNSFANLIYMPSGGYTIPAWV